ncbi:hypothetical protein AVEN_166196-1 [Araneus ventricosus]|uniref:Uncharacterized protein n=1 Tax=Araneus ventricosus TaxID=182803 RepID=A0A4Y2DBG0_ARAVE|nr:hypothetical protein AVEN_166196-1 [Araneus ventricosus]
MFLKPFTHNVWLRKPRVARVNGCTDAIWLLPPPLTCEIFTAITRETTDSLTRPRATSIFPVPTTRIKANRGLISWKDRPWEHSLSYNTHMDANKEIEEHTTHRRIYYKI